MRAPTVCKWEECKVTFWLYWNGKPLTAIRAHVCSTPEQVRFLAAAQNGSMPLSGYGMDGLLPFEREYAIMGAEVRL